MKYLLLSLLCCKLTFIFAARYNDSATFVQAHWQKNKVQKNIMLNRCHFLHHSLFNSNQNISFIEIKKPATRKLHIGYEKQKLLTVDTFAKNLHAFAAINGSFFDVKKGGSVNYLRINGIVIDTNKLANTQKRSQRALAVVGKNKKGKFQIGKLRAEDNWEAGYNWPQMLASGPLLYYNGTAEVLQKEAFNTNRHPRTAVGIKPNGHVILLTVDGRNANAQGVNMQELQKIMHWLGCVSAINLDGGGSVTMWVKGFPDNGIVNYPSDNKKWDHAGQRQVANIIYLK